MQNNNALHSTFKSQDTEELLDIYFYRPLGYAIAIISHKVRITPNMITVISIFTGMIAGHFFYYSDLLMNVWGMLLLVFSNALDSADGQLARMTDNRTRLGRILDGLAGNLWFVSIYVHICLRFMAEGGSAWIFAFAVLTGLFHSFQSAMADYYRNAHLFFLLGREKSEVDSSLAITEKFHALAWKENFVRKLLLAVYLNYTREQELFSGNLQKLYAIVREKYNNQPPAHLAQEFCELNKPLMKYCNILTTNTRMIALFISLYFQAPIYYFVFEITVLNVLLIYLVLRQESVSKHCIRLVS